MRVHTSCAHMGPGADKAAHAHTLYSVWLVHPVRVLFACFRFLCIFISVSPAIVL